jgi:hypothetical protein
MTLPVEIVAYRQVASTPNDSAASPSGRHRPFGRWPHVPSGEVITVSDYKTTVASAELVRHANIYNPVFRHWWQTYQNEFLAKGNDPFTAHQRAVAVLQGLIYQQAAVVAFAYDFALLGLLFAVCLPLVALIRRGRPQPGSQIAEM